MLIVILILAFFAVPAAANDPDDIVLKVENPDSTMQSGEGSTVNTILSAPTVTYGDSKELGTLRISGKEGVSVPVQSGARIRVTLPVGVCYMRTPDQENYKNYIEWPENINGLENQIRDAGDKPGIKFVAATPRSLTIEVNNVDVSGKIMVMDFVFNKENFSTVRVSRLNGLSKIYAKNPGGSITRLEFFELLADMTLPFASCPLQPTYSDNTVDNMFVDADALTAQARDKIKPLIDAGIIAGHQGGLLKPDDYITRAQAIHLVGKIFPAADADTKAGFKDALPWWAEGINNAVAYGIVSAYPDGTFRPEQPITQSEIVDVLQKTLELYGGLPRDN
ncbi:hypothetical protein DCCM_2673 [Desulfocucumis palustris]|uniref:SLH domain-containing protein n=1 Tax=Desulfocucumis palustris TaxID=1898651 RepID=A0A2L2XBS0_9FIRM|nr:hypothetical protein DCCM_2673 [Desulfocucumis palustris]